IQPRDAAQTCGSCHGIPPAGLHPQRSDCGTCHSAVMDLAGSFIAPERHVDGTLDLDPMRCNTCHGSTADGAPPTDIGGGEATNRRGVGAHTAHLRASQTHGPIACSECHVVPTAWDSQGHADTSLPAEISFGALAMSSGARPRYLGDTVSCTGTYCHGGSTPVWTGPRTSEQACGSCHALPPALPHPQTNDCSVCHGAVIDAQRRFVMPDLHVDGRVQVEQTCTACHGSATNSAPPTDLSGGSEPTRLGVGAHQIHLSGGNSSRPLACGECHPVPSTITSAGHLDLQLATPADVVFVGPAAADNRNPRWDRVSATCSGSYCHGPSDPLNASPKWVTAVGGLQCTSCHGWPPAPPHSADTRCGRCHSDVDAQGTIVDRALHVNGEVDLL
ncbi:MAG: CxxxxCH/CxxCH domain c-type cytochrome, partial [Myxococcales bacterium]